MMIANLVGKNPCWDECLANSKAFVAHKWHDLWLLLRLTSSEDPTRAHIRPVSIYYQRRNEQFLILSLFISHPSFLTHFYDNNHTKQQQKKRKKKCECEMWIHIQWHKISNGWKNCVHDTLTMKNFGWFEC